MISMIFNWKKNGWKYLLIASIVVILVCICFNRRKEGTYNEIVKYDGNTDPRVQEYIITHNSKQSVGEQMSRQIAERIFNKPFISVRPPWLKNPVTGQVLELDCFNAELGLAIEYNGKQHYEYTPHFHKSKDEFIKGQYRDEFKKFQCAAKNIILVSIPYTVKPNQLEKHIKDELRGYGFLI